MGERAADVVLVSELESEVARQALDSHVVLLRRIATKYLQWFVTRRHTLVTDLQLINVFA